MALRGSIDDVPIVDVLQFVHLSGKSGVLSLVSDEGPAWVEFSQGNIVFARGPRTRSLGEILVDRGGLTREIVQATIEEQRAEADRPPLGRLLLARGLVTSEFLAECVREQIQNSMLDIAGWASGEFQFDQTNVEVLDDIRVDVAEVLPLLKLNTQFLLLEAVRLFDERRRDETTNKPNTQAAPSREVTMPTPARPMIAATATIDPSPRGPHLREVTGSPKVEAKPSLPPIAAASETAPEPSHPATTAPQMTTAAGIVLVGFEKAIIGNVTESLRDGGYRVLGHVPRREVERQFLQGKRWPSSMVLLWRLHNGGIDGRTPGPVDINDQLQIISALIRKYPGWSLIALVSSWDTSVVGQLYSRGVRAALPLDPMPLVQPGAPATESQRVASMEGLLAVLGQVWRENARAADAQAAELRAWVQAKRLTSEMQRALQRASIALELMRVAANALDRATLFLAKEDELIGLGAFGLTTGGKPMAESLRGLAIRVQPETLLARALKERTAFMGPPRELGLGQLFFDTAGRPVHDRAVLIPLVGPSKTIGVLYGDNGQINGPIRSIHAVELAAAQAGIAYENVLLRLRLDNSRGRAEPELLSG